MVQMPVPVLSRWSSVRLPDALTGAKLVPVRGWSCARVIVELNLQKIRTGYGCIKLWILLTDIL